MCQLLENRAQLVDGGLHLVQGLIPAGQVVVLGLGQHQLLLLMGLWRLLLQEGLPAWHMAPAKPRYEWEEAIS